MSAPRNAHRAASPPPDRPDQPDLPDLSRSPAPPGSVGVAPPDSAAAQAQAVAVMRRYGEGELQAFEELFAQHARAVYDFFYYMTHSREQAVQLSQHAWLRVSRRRGELLEQQRFLPWLFGQAAQVRRERSPAATADMAAADKLAARSAREHGIAVSGDSADAPLHRALSAMAESYREVLVLHCLSGLGFADIAAALGATEAAVKARALQGYCQAAESATRAAESGYAGLPAALPPLSRCPETEKLINLVVAQPEDLRLEPLSSLVRHAYDCPQCQVTQRKVAAGYQALGHLAALARPESAALEQIARAVLPAVAQDLTPQPSGWAIALAVLALLLLAVTVAKLLLH